jgi:hypothetical protein
MISNFDSPTNPALRIAYLTAPAMPIAALKTKHVTKLPNTLILRRLLPHCLYISGVFGAARGF